MKGIFKLYIFKLVILSLAMIFISFGASAKSEEFKILKKNIPAKECVKAYEKGKYVGKSSISKGWLYLLDGFLYDFRRQIGMNAKGETSMVIHNCHKSGKIY